MNLGDIRKRIDFGNYCIDVSLRHLIDNIKYYQAEYNLEMNPDFQRGHVWTEEQQIAFCEFILSGGKCQPFLFNYPNWMGNENKNDTMVCVDGLQRITALLKMMGNELKVFDHFLNEYEDYIVVMRKTYVQVYINNLKTKAEVLQWYIELNAGGTIHTKDEIERVKKMRDEILNIK